MPDMFATQRVKVGRGNDSRFIDAGTTFDFSPDEVAEINSHGAVLRTPKDESSRQAKATVTTISVPAAKAAARVERTKQAPPAMGDDGGL